MCKNMQCRIKKKIKSEEIRKFFKSARDVFPSFKPIWFSTI